MLKALLKFEDGLMRMERRLLVLFVLGMLLLAAYNVFYRNLLVPWQNKLMVSGPPVVALDEPDEGRDDSAGEEGEGAEDDEAVEDDFGGGFGGGFGAKDSADEASSEETGADANDFGGGFGGGFGETDEDEGESHTDAAEVEESDDFGGGFGGGFGESEDGDEGAPADVDNDFGGGFGGGFGDDGSDSAQADTDEELVAEEPAPAASTGALEVPEPQEIPGGPPAEGSAAAMIVAAIDGLKFSWIDSLLRQLVIICGFLGAMLAARQRNHITIDIFGKMLKGRAFEIGQALTGMAAVVVCALLAVSGADLVKLGIEFPQHILPWITQWQFQLIFPIGWGLIGFHFLVRVFESLKLVMDNDFPEEGEGKSQGDPEHKDEANDAPADAPTLQGGAS